jgi:hypothetical protein
MMLVVRDDDEQKVVDIIRQRARKRDRDNEPQFETGEGIILISDVANIIRIRTGESGESFWDPMKSVSNDEDSTEEADDGDEADDEVIL